VQPVNEAATVAGGGFLRFKRQGDSTCQDRMVDILGLTGHTRLVHFTARAAGAISRYFAGSCTFHQ
jgi:hypothetical protein